MVKESMSTGRTTRTKDRIYWARVTSPRIGSMATMTRPTILSIIRRRLNSFAASGGTVTQVSLVVDEDAEGEKSPPEAMFGVGVHQGRGEGGKPEAKSTLCPDEP